MSLSGVLRSKLSSQYCQGCVRKKLKSGFAGNFIPWHGPSLVVIGHRNQIFSGTYFALRTFHMTSNFCIFPKLTSYLNKIATVHERPKEVSHCLQENENKNAQASTQEKAMNYSTESVQKIFDDKRSSYPVHFSVNPKENEDSSAFSFTDDIKMRRRFEKIHKELINNSAMTMKQYEKDISSVLERLSPKTEKQPSEVLSATNLKPQSSGRKKSKKMEQVKYPYMNMSKAKPIKTSKFVETKAFLESLNIPCDELRSYPDIQTMTKNEILDSLILLKENGIHNVFSLYLIQRIFREKSIGEAVWKDRRMKKLMCLRNMQVYLELCKDLEQPDLDIRHLLDRFAKCGQFLNICSASRKIKKLKAIGASPSDILDNFEDLFSAPATLDKKIKLYASMPRDKQALFPVPLFRIKKIKDFTEKLALGQEVGEVAKLLNVSVTNFQACWGFKGLNTKELKYKIHKCLSAGISKREIFNNLGDLDRFPIDKCHAVTSSFRTSGLPVSLHILCDMVDTVGLNGNGNRNNHNSDQANRDGSNNQTNCESETAAQNISGDSSWLDVQHQDWTGEEMKPPTDDKEVQETKSAPKNKVRTNTGIISSKKRRKAIFHLINYLLKLEQGRLTVMYACQINVDHTDVLDVKKNMDLLLSLNFTKEDIASCPLILAHPHEELATALKKADEMVTGHLDSSSSAVFTSSYSPPLSLSTGLSDDATTETFDVQSQEDERVRQVLFSCPTKHLNTVQYFLERENSFSLAAVGTQRLAGFLNLR